MDHAPQIDAEHPFPVTLGVFPKQSTTAAHARVIEHKVRGAIRVDCRAHERSDILGFRHIGTLYDGTRTGGDDFCKRLVQSVLLYVGQHEPHAELRTDAGELAPESRTCSGDDRYFAGEVLHVSSCLSVE